MRRLGAAAAVALALFACRGDAGDSASAGSAATKTAAGEGAMCEEHGVLEAICTRCNPKLIPVFQARGDWCAEHGFPESVCPICHPERGGRPGVDVTGGGAAAGSSQAPADGTVVRFKTRDTARLAGIETAQATESPRERGLLVNVRVAYDATRVAAVNPRSPGVIRSVKADVGMTVATGAPLAIIQSPEIGGARSRLQAARGRLRIAEANHRREIDLHARKISAYVDVLTAEKELQEARAELSTVEADLRVVGGGGSGGAYTLAAPQAGVVTERHATVGNLVGVDQPLFRIVDTSVMWAELEVPETELAQLAVGQKVRLTVDGLGDRVFSGAITYVAPEIDPQTRTALVRAPLDNPDGALRANLFGQARVALGAGDAAALVPRAAVQNARGARLVFIKRADDEYVTRRVVVAAFEGDKAEITSGVKPGDVVVTQGSFFLKTETLKESIGAGCCDVEKK